MARRRRAPQAPPRPLQATPAPVPAAYRPGPVESSVRADVGSLITEHPMGEALAEMAFALARTLDQGAGLAVAAVNRELRANLLELSSLGVGGDDDLDDALSTPVRDEEEP